MSETARDIAERDQAQAAFRNLANIVEGTIRAFTETGMDREKAEMWAMFVIGPFLENRIDAVDVP